MTRNRRRTTRLIVAAALVVPASLASVATSRATPKENLEAGRSKLSEIGHELEVLAEQVNTARAKLDEVEGRLLDARKTKEEAERLAAETRLLLADRAVAAYVGAGSQLEGFLGAEDFNDFSDRLQYAGELAQNDADLAAKADAAGERAQWAAEQYASVAAEQKKAIEALGEQEARFKAQLEAQKDKVAELEQAYRQWQQAQREAAAAAEAAAEAAANQPSGDPGTGYNPNPPNPNWGAARIAVEAARQQIGVTYVWGASTPGVAFDCSGLTMYAWGQAGVSLPHSSAMQAAVTPDVSREQLQEGDLLFFYNPISHVAIYSGGGMMIDASHPGPGGEVDEGPVTWDTFVVGGRPG